MLIRPLLGMLVLLPLALPVQADTYKAFLSHVQNRTAPDMFTDLFETDNIWPATSKAWSISGIPRDKLEARMRAGKYDIVDDCTLKNCMFKTHGVKWTSKGSGILGRDIYTFNDYERTPYKGETFACFDGKVCFSSRCGNPGILIREPEPPKPTGTLCQYGPWIATPHFETTGGYHWGVFGIATKVSSYTSYSRSSRCVTQKGVSDE